MKFSHGEEIKRRNGVARLFLVVTPIVLLFLAVSFVWLYQWYRNNLQPLDSTDKTVTTFVIEPGESARNIGSELHRLGIIRNATAFNWYVGRSDDWSDLQAGTYTLSPSLSVEEIVEKLASGDVATNRITIFPGRRVDELQEDFVEAGYAPEDVRMALNASYSGSILAEKPKNASLEGYLFPDTYEIRVDDTPTDIFQRAIKEFDTRLTEDLRGAFKKQGLNLHEAVTLASIIAGESSVPETQKDIAGVFFNRLKRDMNLGADITFYYAAAVTGQEPNPELDSPYNTRLYGGLPPGPISNFNFSALEAVAYPTKSSNLFFVSADDGQTYFAETSEQHDDNVDRYCGNSCEIQQIR